MKQLTIKSCLILLICILCSAANARYLPANYPTKFDWTGKIEQINGNRIIINDKAFVITSGTNVVTLSSYSTTANSLKLGITVGCVVSSNNQIISLWEFPSNLDSVTGIWSDDGSDDLD